MIDAINISLPHSTQFAEKWLEWVRFRKDIKKSYKTQRGVTMALNKLKAVSEQEAIEMIDNSMANEYQGLYAKKKEKGETDRIYKEIKQKEVSKEPAKYFDPEDGKRFIISKIQQAYEGKILLNDIGEVYSNRLRDHLEHPPLIIEAIEKEVKELSERRPSNRFEEFVEINVELEIRNRILRFNIKNWQQESREIHKEL